MSMRYAEAYEKSISDPEAFWGEAAEDCHWYKKPDEILDRSKKPFYRWFTGGKLNTCYNALETLDRSFYSSCTGPHRE